LETILMPVANGVSKSSALTGSQQSRSHQRARLIIKNIPASPAPPYFFLVSSLFDPLPSSLPAPFLASPPHPPPPSIPAFHSIFSYLCFFFLSFRLFFFILFALTVFLFSCYLFICSSYLVFYCFLFFFFFFLLSFCSSDLYCLSFYLLFLLFSPLIFSYFSLRFTASSQKRRWADLKKKETRTINEGKKGKTAIQ